MTDGAATLTYDVKGQAQAQGVRVMTYALGSGAEQATCKQIACETGGVFSVVGDGKAQRFAPFAPAEKVCLGRGQNRSAGPQTTTSASPWLRTIKSSPP